MRRSSGDSSKGFGGGVVACRVNKMKKMKKKDIPVRTEISGVKKGGVVASQVVQTWDDIENSSGGRESGQGTAAAWDIPKSAAAAGSKSAAGDSAMTSKGGTAGAGPCEGVEDSCGGRESGGADGIENSGHESVRKKHEYSLGYIPRSAAAAQTQDGATAANGAVAGTSRVVWTQDGTKPSKTGYGDGVERRGGGRESGGADAERRRKTAAAGRIERRDDVERHDDVERRHDVERRGGGRGTASKTAAAGASRVVRTRERRDGVENGGGGRESGGAEAGRRDGGKRRQTARRRVRVGWGYRAVENGGGGRESGGADAGRKQRWEGGTASKGAAASKTVSAGASRRDEKGVRNEKKRGFSVLRTEIDGGDGIGGDEGIDGAGEAPALYTGDETVDGMEGCTGDSYPPFEPLSAGFGIQTAENKEFQNKKGIFWGEARESAATALYTGYDGVDGSWEAPESALKPLKTKYCKIKKRIFGGKARKSAATALYTGDEAVDGMEGGIGDSCVLFEPLSAGFGGQTAENEALQNKNKKSAATALYAGDEGVDGAEERWGDHSPQLEPPSAEFGGQTAENEVLQNKNKKSAVTALYAGDEGVDGAEERWGDHSPQLEPPSAGFGGQTAENEALQNKNEVFWG
ncbi:hypothetical protein C8R45DRAFT_937222 [Mycena sanguinolenta]|nr:hypothetical protein C8R45DRAFT_937222 [Mycena sanguinolenta]